MAAALLIAAPASGQGKTTLAAGLARLHARQGRRVRCFKCGPDFLDPLWLQAASGHEVDSLDLWINGEADCARRLAAAAQAADLLIVEGVMGLFDGQPSAADLAERFAIPVLGLVDAAAMAGTFGALVQGLRDWRPGLRWAGVLANRVGSERHAAMLQASLRDGALWLGHLPRLESARLRERHLGLVMPNEAPTTQAALDLLADAIAATPLGQRAPGDWPRWQPPAALKKTPGRPKFSCPPRGAGWAQPGPGGAQAVPSLPPLLAGRRIAVARDAAFAFIYPANLEVLCALGAEPLFFSPLAGERLPECDAVWLPGGYPELHAAALAECRALREQLHAHVQAGRPLWAECGGMMALARELVDAQGRVHPMWGLLDASALLGPGLAGLGPQALDLGSSQAPLRGHSFHWGRLQTRLQPLCQTRPTMAAAVGEAFYQCGSLRASWFHPWFASSPELAARLFDPAPL